MGELDKTVKVGGVEYLISGIPFGENPVWALLSRDGNKVTGPEFMALPDSEKQELAGAVHAYVDTLNQG